MGGYSSTLCLETYSTGNSCKFPTLEKMDAYRSTLPAIMFLFIDTVLIKDQAVSRPAKVFFLNFAEERLGPSLRFPMSLELMDCVML